MWRMGGLNGGRRQSLARRSMEDGGKTANVVGPTRSAGSSRPSAKPTISSRFGETWDRGHPATGRVSIEQERTSLGNEMRGLRA